MMTKSNKQNFMMLAIFLLIGFFLIPSIASAYRQGPGKAERGMGMHMDGMYWASFHVWSDPKTIEELGLSDEQVAQLKEADFAMKENHLELRSQLDQVSLEMEKAFSEKPVNDAMVIELANKMSEIRSKLFLDRVESRLKMTKILSEEQLEKLQTLQPRPCEYGRKCGKYDKPCQREWNKDTPQK